MKFTGIIPARYDSTRFPGKPLVDIGGKSMIERVYTQASLVLDNVFVATDDTRIYDAVEQFGGKTVMTSRDHKSGTDRCYEAVMAVAPDSDVVINIQGDEPFVDPGQIELLKQCFDDDKVSIATLVKKYDSSKGYAALENPNTPKVVFDNSMRALYFSRSVIPYVRNHERAEWASLVGYYTHIGMYAYRTSVLGELTKLPQSSLEKAESLEQLRWLQNGYFIKVAVTTCETVGIDTPDDLKRAVEFCKSHGL